MAKYYLEQIKIEGELKDILAKAEANDVALTIEGRDTNVSAELARILTEMAALPTTASVNTAISTAIDGLIAGAPGTYDTLKEIADYIATHEDAVTGLNAAIGNKVDKVDGMGLSANDFTDALKTKLEGLKLVKAGGSNGYINIGDVETKVYEHPTGEGHTHIPAGGTAGQILTRTADGYAFGDAPREIHYGATAPETMKNGDLFIRVVG